MVAAECVHHCTFIKDYFGVVLDPAHLAAEATWEVVTGLLLMAILRPIVRRWRHRFHMELDEEHGVQHQSPDHEHKFVTAHMLTSNPPIAVSKCECGEMKSVRLG